MGSDSHITVKWPLKNRQNEDPNENGSLLKVESIAECSPWGLMKVESIAECSPWSLMKVKSIAELQNAPLGAFCNTFDLH